MQLREFAQPTIISHYPPEIQRIGMDRNPLSLEGLPSFAQEAANTRELRKYYYHWLSQRCNTLDPQQLSIIRNEYLFDRMSVAIPHLFRYKNGTVIERNQTIKAPNDFISWVNLCNYAVVSTNGNIRWDGVKPQFNANLIEDRRTGVIYQPKPVGCPEGADIKLEYLLLKRNGHYEFEPPTLFYFMAAANYFNQTSEKLLTRLANDHFLDKEIIPRSSPVLPFIAEDILLRRPEQLKNFITGLAKKIGSEEGFALATTIMEDLIETYRPLLGTRLTLFTDVIPAIPLGETLTELRNQYRILKYENRPIVIPPIVRSQAHRQMLAEKDPRQGYYTFLEAVFTGIGAGAKFLELLDAKDIAPIRWIFERALNKKKMEAGQIPIIADILGYPDQETLIWITNLTQLLWAAILDGDDTVDQSPKRGGTASLYVREGMPNGIQKPLLTIIKAARTIMERRGVDSTALGQSVLKMLDDLYTGDLQSREMAWGSSISNYEIYMKRIMQVLAWSPKFMAETTGMNLESASNLTKFMENYGCLILILDDFKDVSEDIGSRVSMFMNGLVKCDAIPVSERNRFIKICMDPAIKDKRLRFKPLNKMEREKIARATDIADRNRYQVTQFLRGELDYYYGNAISALDEVSKQLPLDARNRYYISLFKRNLREVMKAFQSF